MESYRSGNGGQRPRGNQEWNHRTRFNNMQRHKGFGRGFVRPSLHASNQFMPPQLPVPMLPFGNGFMYPDLASPMFYVQGQPPLQIEPMYFPFQDPDLRKKIVKQIDYYFSNENLVSDLFLRKKMDQQGWVPVSLIASFKKVSCLTDNVQLVLNVMRTSNVVEVKGVKMRKRNEWKKWIIPKSVNVDNFYGNSVSNCNKLEVKGVSMVLSGQQWLK